ncbi:MAG: type II toxin-antitoxin system RelE/ParE family toxin [Puniceicoccaceae bacterium]|nr:type II toxin-antitoxin system RelE/ParE family toxin [Puniceicoccaceae bacterium]
MGSRQIYASPLLARKVKKLKKQEKTVLDDAVLDIVGDPSIGEEKIGDLAGVRVYKFKINKQLILLSYTYDEIEINVLHFGSHENFYRDLKNYKKA